MSRKDKTTILTTPSKPVLRMVFFIIAVALAIWGFTTAILNLGSKARGYQNIQSLPDADFPYFQLDYMLMYNITATGLETKAQFNAVQSVYSDAMKKVARLLDTEVEYDGIVNLATLNNNPGKVYELDPWLYQVLSEAYAITLSGSNYNMFAGALHEEWNSILILDDPQEFDPEFNDYTAERLSTIAAASAPEHFTLVLEGGKASFEADSVYKTMCEQYEIVSPALDLNVMKEAFVMDYVVSELCAAGHKLFNLTSSSGLCINVDESTSNGYLVYYEDGTTETLGAEGRSVFFQARAFKLFDNDLICYNIKAADGRMLYRSRYFDVTTGVQSDKPSNIILAEGEVSCVSVMRESLDSFVGGGK